MITGLNHITLSVADVERSFTFYKDVMGFKPLCKWEKGAYFLVGDIWFCLNAWKQIASALSFSTSSSEYSLLHVLPSPSSPSYTHYSFSIGKTIFDVAKEKLLAAGVIEFQDNKSPGESFYFLDPDGHKLEIHTGTWQERLDSMRGKPDVEFFV